MAKKTSQVKLSQLEASQLYSIEQGDLEKMKIDAEAVVRLAKRGLVTVSGNDVSVSGEGRAAFKRFMGGELTVAAKRY